MRADKAKAAAQIDVLKADDTRIQAAIDVLDRRASGLSDKLDTAKRDEQSAAADARTADATAGRAREGLRVSQEALRRQAVRSYSSGNAPSKAHVIDPTGASIAAAGVYVNVARGRSVNALDEVRAARVDADAANVAARRASDRAASRRTATAAALSEVTVARVQQSNLADRVEAKVSEVQGGFDALAAEDAQLSAAIARQDEQAAARRRAELLKQQEQQQQQQQTTPRAPGGPVPVSGSVGGLTTVRGITVASSIAGQISQLLTASDAAGLRLSGGGYRSSQGQINTRRNNCGTSDYDVYQKPASQCSPPTARPGQSMHEKGLAIDFTNNGSLLSRSNPAYGWLKQNAGRFGLSNLPSEAWHWSTNGN